MNFSRWMSRILNPVSKTICKRQPQESQKTCDLQNVSYLSFFMFALALTIPSASTSIASTPRASTSRASTLSVSILEETKEPDRDIFAGNNLVAENELTSEIEVPLDELIVNGCGCTRNCVAQFPAEDLMESHLSASELNYYCKDHVNHLNLFTQGKNLCFVPPQVVYNYFCV